MPNGFVETLREYLHCDAQLHARGLRYIDGIGRPPTNGWAGEDSVSVLGIDRHAAVALGREYGQNAVIWSGPSAYLQLCLSASPGST
jgi:hypothetical protein